ncbi:MAG: SDR family NAD(P)-dependent oxidoreductase [Dehalococcoidales bacterium]|nr:SDR family NAD(P)-dependent oxidoreductase [Dehalococcoidales bacterium]
MELADETAVVTGAGQGIGLEVALTLARNGANLVLLDINEETLKTAARQVEAIGHEVLPIKCDISNKKQVEAAAKAAFDRFHSVYILVNNAGQGGRMPLVDLTEELWDTIINSNVKGTFLCTQAFGRLMLPRGKGRIVNISSVAARRSSAGGAAYTTAKAGVWALTRATAIEWAKSGIRVNSISPGTVATPRRARMTAAGVLGNNLEAKTPLGYIAKPVDIANAVLFLVSSNADYITGADLAVDGGVLALHPRYA